MFNAVRQHAPPAWWSDLSSGETLFSDQRWLDLFARSRGEPAPWWFSAGPSAAGSEPGSEPGSAPGSAAGSAAGSGQPAVGLRGTVVEAGARKSMNPYRWLFERTPYHDREPFEAATAPDPDAWFPALLCSYPGLDAYPVGAGDDQEVVQTLLAGLTRWASEHGVRSVVIGFVQPELAAFGAAATAAGYRALPVATRANLPISGRPAEEVFASWSTQQRNNLRRLRRRLHDRGVRIVELERPLPHLDALVDLRCAHSGQHGKVADPAEERAWLEPLLTTLADRVTLFGAFTDPAGSGGSPLRGFALFVDDGRWWNAFAVARRDPEQDRDVYFELMFNTPVEAAAARGIAEISFGYGTGEAKRRRGCRFATVAAWYYSTDPSVADWLAAHHTRDLD